MAASDFTVTFLGVGGSCSVGSPRRARYGANTPCVMVEAGDSLVILDMGTGLARLPEFRENKQTDRADILLSHFHCDHIEGLPFFNPFFASGRFDIYACPPENTDTERVLSGYMKNPYMPIGFADFRAELRWHDLNEPSFVTASGIPIKTFALNHPGGATGYRLEHEGHSLVYCCDHEPRSDERPLVEFCRDTDLIIYDAFFTSAEYATGQYTGWGHSHHEAGFALAQAAAAKCIAFTHHHIRRSDDALDALAARLGERQPPILMASEGMKIDLGKK
jgi:phosphoribosyl 1,2-cyclic phosphodiesterase